MNIINKKLKISFILLFMSIAAIAQPPDPGGGTGGVGPGAKASSIDMYAVFLIVAAIIFVMFFAKKYINKIAK